MVANGVRREAEQFERLVEAVAAADAEAAAPLPRTGTSLLLRHLWMRCTSRRELWAYLSGLDGLLGALAPSADERHFVDAPPFAPDELGGSFILNLHSGEDEPLVEENVNYYMDVWVLAPSALPFVRQP